MQLFKGTTVHLVDKGNGHVSQMSLEGWTLALKGGSKWEEVEIFTDLAEAQKAARKYGTIAEIERLVMQMDDTAVNIFRQRAARLAESIVGRGGDLGVQSGES